VTAIVSKRNTVLGRGLRRPDPVRYFAVKFTVPAVTVDEGQGRTGFWITALVISGVLFGSVYGLRSHAPVPVAEDEIFVLEETAATPPEMPPPPDPEPPPPQVMPLPEELPPPQFGLEEDALSDAGDLVVASGNTIMQAADTVVLPPAPSLPPAPELLDQPPRIVQGNPPEYPARALDRGLEGVVVALITIDTMGKVQSVTIEKSGGSDFDPAVLLAARQTVFQAPIRQGHKVAATFRRPFEFRLE
jgi:periplasmic protein TonB